MYKVECILTDSITALISKKTFAILLGNCRNNPDVLKSFYIVHLEWFAYINKLLIIKLDYMSFPFPVTQLPIATSKMYDFN